MTSATVRTVPGTTVELATLTKRLDLGGGHTINLPMGIAPQFSDVSTTANPHWMSLPDFKAPRIDPSGFVFIGRAIRELGHALFPEEWNGTEPAVNLALKPLPELTLKPQGMEGLGEWVDGQNTAARLLGLSRPQKGSFPPAHWARAQALREEALALIRPARARLSVVISEFERCLAAGTLKAHLQHIDGGDLGEERPASEWLVPYETLLQRILTCRMSASAPFGRGVPATHYIFVERAGLAKLISAKRQSPRKPDRPTTLTHRQKFMDYVGAEVRRHPDGPPSGKSRDSYINEGASFFKLPVDAARTAYKHSLDNAGAGDGWTKKGRKPKQRV